jgi:hypothetical protein
VGSQQRSKTIVDAVLYGLVDLFPNVPLWVLRDGAEVVEGRSEPAVSDRFDDLIETACVERFTCLSACLSTAFRLSLRLALATNGFPHSLLGGSIRLPIERKLNDGASQQTERVDSMATTVFDRIDQVLAGRLMTFYELVRKAKAGPRLGCPVFNLRLLRGGRSFRTLYGSLTRV